MITRYLNLIKLKQEIIMDCIEDTIDYYGEPISIYNEIDEYLDRLDNIYDKISLAQWANNHIKLQKLVGQLNLEEQAKQKYIKLKNNNIEINDTLNFEILSPKYGFLNDILDMIVTDIKIQEKILMIPDDMLELFKIFYERITEISDYPVPYICNLLKKIRYIDPNCSLDKYQSQDKLNLSLSNLIKSGYTFTETELDTLLYLYNSPIDFDIKSIEDVRLFSEQSFNFNSNYESVIFPNLKAMPIIDRLKTVLLLQTYGIDLEQAQEILLKYDISDLPITEANRDLFEMYIAIYSITNETKLSVLEDVYNNFKKDDFLSINFMRTVTFENDLRKEFSKNLNNTVFKTDNEHYMTIDGVKVYDAGLSFKMIITVLGAYQLDFKDMDNYSDYWNSPHIKSHSNSCSLIGNNNLSMANIKNIILGFSTMSDNMLLLCSNKDLNSTPYSRNFNPIEKVERVKYTIGNKLLDSTRGDYNELTYERRDLSANPKFYKKNPDYIVFVEEYIDIDEYISLSLNDKEKLEFLLNQKQQQEHIWKESIKAAQNFGIPIVKINRERCAQNEIEKIDKMVEEFEKTLNPHLISAIITQFQNNRFGNKNNHDIIKEKYFSKEKMESILNRINNTIIQIDNPMIKRTITDLYYKSILIEEDKVSFYKYIMDTEKESAIDFERTKKEIKGFNGHFSTFDTRKGRRIYGN